MDLTEFINIVAEGLINIVPEGFINSPKTGWVLLDEQPAKMRC